MNVTEETLVGVENGRVNLTDYALEVGVRFHVQVENPGKLYGKSRILCKKSKLDGKVP